VALAVLRRQNDGMPADRKQDRHNKDRVGVTLRLDPDDVARLDERARETGTDRHTLIVMAIREYLAGNSSGR
jgi:hypothetical protein